MIAKLIGEMPDRQREFLVGFEHCEPNWELLEIPHVADLPAVRWRQRNLDKLSLKRRSALVDLLVASLQGRAHTNA